MRKQVVLFLTCEANAFFLKFVLWVSVTAFCMYTRVYTRVCVVPEVPSLCVLLSHTHTLSPLQVPPNNSLNLIRYANPKPQTAN